jgi:hypothetical protein
MKVHKRLYTALPRAASSASASAASAPAGVRVRSNSASTSTGSARTLYTAPLAFFDAPPLALPGAAPPPPPPSSRPSGTGYAIPSRLAAEAKLSEGQQPSSNQQNQHSNQPPSHQNSGNGGGGPPPYSLAFSSSGPSSLGSYSATHYPLFYPYAPFGGAPLCAGLEYVVEGEGEEEAHLTKRPRTRYHLDVGAYGIPKHARDVRRGAGRATTSTMAQGGAVQVGEDAYFIRENAMGIADGVGGWARNKGKGRERGRPYF